MTYSVKEPEKIGSRLPTIDERDAANRLRQVLVGANSERSIRVNESSGGLADITLSPALCELLSELLDIVGSGDAVTLSRIPAVLTLQQAADLLNVPRSYVAALLKSGEISPCAANRHRLNAEDVLTFKSSRDSDRALALDELATHDSSFL